MKTRTNKILLILLRDYIIHDIFFSSMCLNICDLYSQGNINYQEKEKLFNYLRKYNSIQGYWFPVGQKEPRLRWLNKQINKKWYETVRHCANK